MKGKKIVYRDMNDATPTQAAVLGDLILGATYGDIHLKYGIAYKTASRWAEEFQVRKPPIPNGKNMPLPQQNTVQIVRRQDITPGKVEFPENQPGRMADQIYGYVFRSLAALESQLEVAGDPNYIKRQNASDLATLHKVIGDRAVELINALNAGERGETGDETD